MSFYHSLLCSWEIDNGKKLTVLDSKDCSPLKTLSYVSHCPMIILQWGRHVPYFIWEAGSGLQNISGLSWVLQGGSSFMGSVALRFWVLVLCGGSVKAFVLFDLENWAAGGKHVMWLFSPKWCGFHMFYFWKCLTNSRSEFIRWFYQDGRVYSTWKPVFQLFFIGLTPAKWHFLQRCDKDSKEC